MAPPYLRLLSVLCGVALLVLMIVNLPAAGTGAQDPAPAVVWLLTTHSGDAVARYDDNGTFIDSFVQPGSGGLQEPRGLAVGSDGNLYVVDAYKDLSNILQFNGQTGAFITTFAMGNGLDHPYSMTFAPAGSAASGSMLVTNQDNSEVSRFNATTGADDGIFIQAGSGGLDAPRLGIYGPDGNYYVASRNTNAILRYDGGSGAFIDAFVTPGSGDLSSPIQFLWGPDGNLYVGSEDNNKVLRYDGTTGAFTDTFVDGNHSSGGGLTKPSGLAFDPLDGDLYVASRDTGQVLRYDGSTGAFLGVFIDTIGGSNGALAPLTDPEFILPCVLNPSTAQRAAGIACPFTTVPAPAPTPSHEAG
jgi:DNA-binding beta-propeller fold protein YncE